MPRFYERYNKGLAPYSIPAWLWIVLTLFCLLAAIPSFGLSLALLVVIAWDRQIRRDSEPTPVSKINADLIEEDLRKGREKKAAESGRSDYVHRSVGDRDWNPLGMPKDQWWDLSAEERAAAYKKYFGQNREEPTRQQPHVRYGPRGGRYTEETTSDGRRYRRYF